MQSVNAVQGKTLDTLETLEGLEVGRCAPTTKEHDTCSLREHRSKTGLAEAETRRGESRDIDPKGEQRDEEGKNIRFESSSLVKGMPSVSSLSLCLSAFDRVELFVTALSSLVDSLTQHTRILNRNDFSNFCFCS